MMKVIGSRAEVLHGTAHHTSGNLTKEDLFLDKTDGRIKSKAKSMQAKKSPHLKAWRNAMEEARESLPVNQRSKFPLAKGKLLERARENFKSL
jgi:hypothetical protein